MTDASDAPTHHRRRARRPRFGLCGRLLALVTVPLCVVATFGAVQVSAQHGEARSAVAISNEARGVAALTRLMLVLRAEQTYAETAAWLESVGLTWDYYNAASGLPPGTDQFDLHHAETRAVLREAGTLTGEHPDLVELFDELAGASSLDPIERATLIDRALRIVAGEADRWVAHLVSAAGATASDELSAATDAERELVRVTDAYIALPDAATATLTAFGAGDAADLVALQRAAGAYESASGDLEAELPAALRAAWAAADADTVVGGADVIAAAVTARDAGTLSPTGGAALLAHDDAQFRRLSEFAAHVAAQVGQEADAHATATHSTLVWVLASIVAAIAATSALAFVIASTIRRPIASLAAFAEALGEGDLDRHPDVRALPEAIAAARALDDAVRHLHLAKVQADALANGDLGAACFDEVAPGGIGAAMQSSVQRLRDALMRQDELQRRLSHLAVHDPLTGLPNRAGALDAMHAARHRAQRSGETFALLFCDLDGFKAVNDTYGHDVGDQLLREVAERMRAAVRAADVPTRLGGDEFIVVAERIGGLSEAAQLGERLLAAVAQPITLDGITLEVGVSVGVALDTDGDPSALLAAADAAMRRAKEAGKSTVVAFDEQVRCEIERQATVAHALRAAVPGGELEVFYQPIVDAVDGRLHSVEALVRWRRPDGTLVAPGEFIPIAEQSDLIIAVDRWVLRRVAEDLTAWRDDAALAGVPVAVNLSGRHLPTGTLVDDVAAVLVEVPIAPQSLLIELTETVLVADIARTSDVVDGLHELGVRVALDDFGTGYTSLSQLCRLSIDELKIDASFVADVTDSRSRSVVHALVELAATLGLTVVAEGVEEVAQLDRLREAGCRVVQGYLVAWPMPEPALRSWASAPLAVAGFAAAQLSAA